MYKYVHMRKQYGRSFSEEDFEYDALNRHEIQAIAITGIRYSMPIIGICIYAYYRHQIYI